jgi:uncharacterized protein YcaQ
MNNLTTYVEKNERRTERLTLTLTSTERAKLETQARAQGCALTEYIRAIIRYVQAEAKAKAEVEAAEAKAEATPSVEAKTGVNAEAALVASV